MSGNSIALLPNFLAHNIFQFPYFDLSTSCWIPENWIVNGVGPPPTTVANTQGNRIFVAPNHFNPYI